MKSRKKDNLHDNKEQRTKRSYLSTISMERINVPNDNILKALASSTIYCFLHL